MRDPFTFMQQGWPHGMPYTEAKALIDPTSLPRLHAALKDPAQATNWSKIAVLIGYLGNDQNSARAIIDYIRRVEDWAHVPVERQYFQAVLKVQCLVWAGKMNDKATGATVWEERMELPPYGTPMTYLHAGKQYVVVACGGNGAPSRLLAYALP